MNREDRLGADVDAPVGCLLYYLFSVIDAEETGRTAMWIVRAHMEITFLAMVISATEIDRFFRQTGKIIIPLTVNEIITARGTVAADLGIVKWSDLNPEFTSAGNSVLTPSHFVGTRDSAESGLARSSGLGPAHDRV